MVHDDGCNTLTFKLSNKLTLLYSMLAFNFDGLSVARTCFVELGCDELHMGHALNPLKPRTSDGQ